MQQIPDPESLGAWNLPLITTKLSPPRLAQRSVVRSGLLNALNQHEKAALVLVDAAAGFGKTTLLAQWRKELLGRGRQVAWLSLDGEDRTPHQFLTYLVTALGNAVSGVGDGASALLQSGPMVPSKVVLSILINELASLDQQCYLMLDDYHLLDSAEIDQLVSYLLHYAPENFHLVVASRVKPTLPLAELQAQGLLYELEDKDLRFEVGESQQFFDNSLSDKLTSSDVQRLHDATEGWVTGLQIASVSPGIKLHVDGFRDTLHAGGAAIHAYMDDVVLASLSEEVQQFLLSTSLLERFNASLCKALTENQNCPGILDFLQTNRLFIQPLDELGEWFRYHHLFTEHLRLRLTQEAPDKVEALHRKAYQWFSEQQLWTEAVRHALAAGDHQQAADWVEQCAMSLVESSNMALLMEWVESLYDTSLTKRLPLLISEAWALALLFEFDKALKLVEQIEAEVEQEPEQEREAVTFIAKVIRVLVLGLSDDPVAAGQLGGELLERWPAGAELPWAVGVLLNVLTYSHLHAGEYEKAKDVQLLALDDDSGQSNLFVTIYRKNLLGLIALKQGKMTQAERWFEGALKLGEAREGRRSVAASMSACFLAKVRYEQNRLDEAKALLADRWDVIDEGCFIDSANRAYLVSARLLCCQGDPEQAVERLLHADRLATKRGWKRMQAACSAERIRILLSEGELKSAKEQLERLQSLVPEDRSPIVSASSSIAYFEVVARVRVELAEQADNPTVLREADLELERLVADLQEQRSLHAALEVQTLRAVVLAAREEASQALLELQSCLEQAERMGFVRTLLNEGRDLLALLKAYVSANPEHSFARDLLTEMVAEQDDLDLLEEDAADSDEVGVSQRELEILTLISKGLSNKEVAALLDISLGTVKWHVKNIYRKLGVSSRTQAVSEASAMGLL